VEANSDREAIAAAYLLNLMFGFGDPRSRGADVRRQPRKYRDKIPFLEEYNQ
jgi:hypothetical protein